MKIKNVLHNFITKAFKQFLFPMFYIIAFSTLAIWMIIADKNGNSLFWLLITLGLGLVYSIFITSAANIKSNKFILYISNVLLIAILIVFYRFIPKQPPLAIVYRIIVVYIVGFLCILSVPAISKQNQNTFWTYNFEIFLQGIITYIYAGVLFIGLSIALSIVSLLFNIAVSKAYLIVSVLTLVTFAGTLFLSLFPKHDVKVLRDYPKLLKILVFYILMPLTIVYLLILYIYTFKILITWHIPTGEVSYMVLSFSALGLLSLMSIFPILKDEKYKFVQKFSKYFYPTIFPLILLLFVSIIQRISQYGITENRFFILIFALWMTFIAIYMIISKMNKISIVHISLIILLIVSSFGPWSAFNISKNSQLKRMKQIINNCVENETTNKKEISSDKYNELKNIVEYEIKNHGLKLIEDNFDIVLENYRDTYNLSQFFLDKMNIVAIDTVIDTANIDNEYFSVYSDHYENVLNISDYDIFIPDVYLLYQTVRDSIVFTFDKDKFILGIDINNKNYEFNIENELRKIILDNGYNYRNDKILIIRKTSLDSTLKCGIIIKSISGYMSDSLEINNFETDILIGQKNCQNNE